MRLTMRWIEVNYDPWELGNEYFVRRLCDWKSCLKKIVSRKFIKEYKCWEKMNNLERFTPFRISHRRYFVEKGFLKTFASFTRKHLYWSLFLKTPILQNIWEKRIVGNNCFLPFMCICNKLLCALESALFFNHGFTQTFFFRALPEVFFFSF